MQVEARIVVWSRDKSVPVRGLGNCLEEARYLNLTDGFYAYQVLN